jgi:hypothetical protein
MSRGPSPQTTPHHDGSSATEAADRRCPTTAPGTASAGAEFSEESSPDLPDHGFAVPDDPGEVYPTLVERNDRVCRRCLVRLRRQERFPKEAGRDYGRILSFVESSVPDGADDASLDREFLERVELPERVARGHTEDGRTTYCANCGTTEPHRTPPTRSAGEARDAAINLSSTLRELGVAHDWLLLVRLVEEMKSRPKWAGDDFEVFRRATAGAVRRAREGSDGSACRGGSDGSACRGGSDGSACGDRG